MFGNYYNTFTLNDQSRRLINNIYVNLSHPPTYASFCIEKDEASYAFQGGIAIKVSRNGRLVNMFLFFGSPSGKIGSCAIYGSSLSGHKAAIERNMNFFGLPVLSVSFDEGFERFLDVILEDYNL